MTKRHPADKEARRKASRDFYANEIAWGIQIGLNLGLDADGIIQLIASDVDAWADHVDWKAYN